MTDVSDLETASYATWTPDVVGVIGGWHVTATGGVTRRINSARAVGNATVDAGTLAELAEWFGARGVPFLIRETPLMAVATSEAVRSEWGFTPFDETLVMTATTRSADARGVRTVSIRNSTFQAELARLNGREGDQTETLERIYARVSKRGSGIWIPGRGVGVVVRYRDWAAVFSVAVVTERRRSGLGTRIMEAASSWAVGRGVGELFVQVLGTNEAAVALYEELGFTESYRYRYLQAPHDGGSA